MRYIISVSAAAIVTASLAAAEVRQQQGPPKPAPEMAQMAFMEGTWTCQGKMFQTPFSPAGTMTSSAEIRKDLGGFFQTGVIKGTSKEMPPFEGRFHLTYDSGTKQFVMLWVDNMGGWSQTTSSGWKGDTIVYSGEGHMGGQKVNGRDTFTKSGPTSMRHSWEMEIGGKWTPAGDETCQKK